MAITAVPPLRRGRSTIESTRRWAVLGAAGIGAALAWFAISLFSGPSAHAADHTDNPLGSLLGGVSSTLSPATTPVLDPVAEILTPVTTAVAPVVETVAPPVADLVTSVTPVLEPLAPLGDVVAPVGEAVGGVVSPLTPLVAPVTEALKPVVDAAAPVTDAVSSLPVVDHLVPPQTSGIPPHGSPASPVTPSTPSVVFGDTFLTPLSGPAAQIAAFVGDAGTVFSTSAVSMSTLAAAVVPGVAAVVTPSAGGSSVPGLPFGSGLLPLDPTSSLSSGAGFSFGASAVLVFDLFAALRAWMPRCAPGDDSALPAPVFDTDVSPD
ncbi:hypothetical protein OR221_0133 [Microbacterium laevaniformans OR221]|nr:hypothetical protein OR221_0133 [Microbacterium laevaniformans OR221]